MHLLQVFSLLLLIKSPKWQHIFHHDTLTVLGRHSLPQPLNACDTMLVTVRHLSVLKSAVSSINWMLFDKEHTTLRKCHRTKFEFERRKKKEKKLNPCSILSPSIFSVSRCGSYPVMDSCTLLAPSIPSSLSSATSVPVSCRWKRGPVTASSPVEQTAP